ncbi:hypothetical protein F2Q68_00020067, partial [Brassica cretica]
METSFMHVLPDSFQMLSSECLEDDPWQKFPFTRFVAMLSVTSHSAIMATSFYSSKTGSEIVPAAGNGDQERANPIIAHGHSHRHGVTLTTEDDSGSQLLGYRANGFGAWNYSSLCGHCTISRHGSWWLHPPGGIYNCGKVGDRLFPGIALSSIYRDNSPAALITVGLFNACSLHGPRQPSSSRVHGTKAP